MEFVRPDRGGRGVSAQNRGLFAAALVGVLLCVAPASGGAPAVAVGRIATVEPGVQDELRLLVNAELQALRLPESGRQRFLLDVSLDEMRTVRAGERVETTCAVSATLREADDGALRAILKGRARAGDTGAPPRRGRVAALSGAVRSALRRVPEAVAR
jgi:hypothetical protein